MSIVFLNGRYLPEDQASVPVTDRGFMFGDGVYEVIPAYAGLLFRLEEHLARLQDSLDGVRIANPQSPDQWRAILEELLVRNDGQGGDFSVYLQVTRGAARRDHAFPQGVSPTVFASASLIVPPAREVLETGISAITAEDIRWRWCHIKAITLLPNVLLRQQAIDSGCAEAIILRDGFVTEGSASNVFVVIDGRVLTPTKGIGLLPGITRDVVLELAQENAMPCAEAPISDAQLRAADEIWVTSSVREVVAVTRLDGRAVGSGRPGPVWSAMYRLFQGFKQRLRSGKAE